MDGMKERSEDLIRKIMDEESDKPVWEKFNEKVNMALDLYSNNKLSAEESNRFWTMHESMVAEHDKGKSELLFASAIVVLNALSEKVVIDEAHRSPFEYQVNEEYIQLLLKEYEEPNKAIIVDESSRIKNILLDVYKDNSKLITLDPREFEEMVAELLAKQGFKVELTKRTRDGGYDIIALLDYKFHNPVKFLVECKRRKKNKVGIEVIRGFKNVVDSTNSNRGILVTTSYFTKDSWDEQKKYPYLLDYRDKDQVIEWVKGYFNNNIM